MPVVCSVKFPYAARDLWFDANGLDPRRGQAVICETERGLEYGVVSGEAHEVDDATLERTTGGAELKPLVRVATAEDDELEDDLEAKGAEAMAEFTGQVEELGLDMKPIGVEFLFGGEGAVCYFVADNRVDFRQLARNLSRTLHSHVDLRQIGVREQASIMGGLAHCGQEYCCSRLGQGFGPVTIRMAKDQDLPLNSPKISGACGRLMCCLRYEDEAYRDFKRRAPKKNAMVETPFGEARVSEFDTPREAVGLRLEDNRTIRVPLASMECSEAAQERSERTGVPCRPDCVTLQALERLESPQVRLALAQLRAQTELTEEDWMPKEDILPVDEEPEGAPEGRGRRRRGSGGDGGQEEGAPRGRRRRRRGRLANAPSGGGEAAEGGAGEPAPQSDRPQGDGPQGGRAQRGRSQGGRPQGAGGSEAKGRTGEQGKGQGQRKGATSRRRHHGQEGPGGSRQQRRPRQRNDLGQKAKRPSGGQEAKPATEPKNQAKAQTQVQSQAKNAPAQPRRQRPPRKQQDRQQQPQRAPKATGQAKAAEDRKPGRARRRRRRHGGGGAGNAGGAGGGSQGA